MLTVYSQQRPGRPRLLKVLLIGLFTGSLAWAGWIAHRRAAPPPPPLGDPVRVSPAVSIRLPSGWSHRQLSLDQATTLLAAPQPIGDLDAADDPVSELSRRTSPLAGVETLVLLHLDPRPAGSPSPALFLDTDASDRSADVEPARLGPLVAVRNSGRLDSLAAAQLLASAPDGTLVKLMVLSRRGSPASCRTLLAALADQFTLDLPPATDAVARFTRQAGVKLALPGTWLAYAHPTPNDLPATPGSAVLEVQPAAPPQPTGVNWQMTVGATWLAADQSPGDLLTEVAAQTYLWLSPPAAETVKHERLSVTRLAVPRPPRPLDDPATYWLAAPAEGRGRRPAVLVTVLAGPAQAAAAQAAVLDLLHGLSFEALPAPGPDRFADWAAYHRATPLADQATPERSRRWYLREIAGKVIGYRTQLTALTSGTASSPASQPATLTVQSMDHYPRLHRVGEEQLSADGSWSVTQRDALVGRDGAEVGSLRIQASQPAAGAAVQVQASATGPRAAVEASVQPPADYVGEPAVTLLVPWLARHGRPGDQVAFSTLGLRPGSLAHWTLTLLDVPTFDSTRWIEWRCNVGPESFYVELTPAGEFRQQVSAVSMLRKATQDEVVEHFRTATKDLMHFTRDLQGP